MLVCWWMLNVVGFKSDYHSTQPALAIVLHKKWRLSVDYNLTPPHLREEKNVREKREESSPPQAMRNLTGAIHKNHHRRCWGLCGVGGISVCPPLCHPHLSDHITNRAFSKRSFSKGAQWGLSAINKAVWKQRDILKKSKALAGMAIISARLLESDKGAGPCRKGCSAPGLLALTYIPPTGTHCRLIASANGKIQTFLHVSGPSLILYMWKNSWRDRLVKGSIIYNPCSVYGEKIRSYFSNPSVVLHGWWLLPHASLTWFKENKITLV